MSKYLGKRVFYYCKNCGKPFTLSKESIDDSLESGFVFCKEICFNQYNEKNNNKHKGQNK